jgi:hypothetical protein
MKELILIPKIPSNIKIYTMDDWYKIYTKEIEYIIDIYIGAITKFNSNEYSIGYNIHNLRNSIIKLLYKSSINKQKQYILGVS